MGIQGLLPLLKPIQKPVSIAEDFAGEVIAVDAYCWLHKGAYGCAMELVEGKKSFVYVVLFSLILVTLTSKHNGNLKSCTVI